MVHSVYKKESRHIITLAMPVLIASIAQTGMSFVDTVMAGGVSALDMAAVAVASSLWFPIILLGVGVLMAVTSVIAEYNGAQQNHKVVFAFQQSLYTAAIMIVPLLFILQQSEHLLGLLGVDANLADKTVRYLEMMYFALPAFLLFQALRSLTDGLSLTKPAMVTGLLGLLLNVPVNWIFVYGKFGMPAMGGVGCGVATAIVSWFSVLGLFSYILFSRKIRALHIFQHWVKPDLKEIKHQFKIGIPVAAAIFFEVTLFATVSIVISPLGPKIVAAHQIAINYASLLFMIPMSIGTAASIRVGHVVGEGDFDRSVITSKVSLMIGVCFAVLIALLTYLFREQIVLMYNDDLPVITLAMHLLMFTVFYQIVDTIQVIASGALRGYKDMKAIFICTIISYWGLGLPFGYILGMTDMIVPNMGVSGFWIGFIIGLTSASLLLGWRLHWIARQGAKGLSTLVTSGQQPVH